MSTSQPCPKCGCKLDEPGFCPACAWQGLLADEEGLSGAGMMRLPGHELLEEIARGGMGIVYRARQLDPRRTVALKMLLPQMLASPGMAERFRLEVRTLTELEHPAILPVHQTGEHDGLPFFTMKLATGGTLAQQKGGFAGEWRRISELVATLADAVQFAHERGVLHRDLKPANILFDEQNRPYISDFGLAKIANDEMQLTRSIDFLGTPHYVAPEIATRSARQATTASDIYSLGAILFELLSGGPPFEAESVPALLKKIVEEEASLKPKFRNPISQANSNSETRNDGSIAPHRHSNFGIVSNFESRVSNLSFLPRDLEVICLKCLEKEPGRRYASARALADDLRHWLAGEPILARPVTKVERAWKWVRRNPRLATLTAALLLSLIGGGFGLWRSDRAVRSALSATRKAETESQMNLREALLAQSQALGAAHATGQRWAALEALARAARIRPSLELRNEAAAALARPDLREIRRFAANIRATGSSVVFTSDLEGYIAPELSGGFSLRRTKDQSVITSFPDAHDKPARYFVLSRDDRQVAALMDDYSMEIWDLNRTFERPTPPPGQVSIGAGEGNGKPRTKWNGTIREHATVEFHPDGVSLAVHRPKEGLFLEWGEQAGKSPEPALLKSTNGTAIYMRFDSAGERVAVVRDPVGVEMWKCAPEPELLWFQSMKPTVPWLAWSPDGLKLAAAADDGRGLRIFSATNGRTELVYSHHLLYARQFEFDPSGRTIASMGQDWALRLWDARTGQDLVTSVGRHRVMRFSQDGRRLCTAPTDRQLAILEVAPEDVFRQFSSTPSPEEVTPSWLRLSADGRLLATVHPHIRIFDIARGEEIGLLNLPMYTTKQAFFDHDAPAIDSGATGGTIFYSLYGKGTYRRTFSYAAGANGGGGSFQWGAETVVANHSNAVVWNAVESGQTWMRHGRDGVEIWPQRDHTQARRIGINAPLERLAASENGHWAAAPDYVHQTVTVCDCRTGQTVTNLSARGIDQVWFSPDSRWLVASLESGYCTWETESWKPGTSWTAHLDSGNPGEIAFSADGRFVAARHEREVFRLLSFPDCQELVTLKPPLVVSIRNACLSADGGRLWLLGSGYRLFEWNLRQLRSELTKLGLDWEETPVARNQTALESSGTAPVLLFKGKGTSPNDVTAIETILKNKHLEYSTVNSSQLNDIGEAQLRDYRLLIVPGGNFIQIGNGVSSNAIVTIRNAVQNGLNYLGICAGAFFASDSGYNSLNLTSGIRFKFYAAESRGIRKEAVPIAIVGGPTLDHYWEDGPELTGWGAVVGKYPDGTPAIVEATFGSGCVILSGVHPEAPANWRRGMNFTTSADVDNEYAWTLIQAALNRESLPHY
jgi:serine/threonine protein kinase/WD40 repeat protein